MSRGKRSTRAVIKRVRDALARTDADIDVNLVLECPVAWDSMRTVDGHDGTVRHCQRCDSKVYDLTQTRKSEVLALIRRSGGNVCGQVARRSDGRIVFGMCSQSDHLTLVRGGLVSGPR